MNDEGFRWLEPPYTPEEQKLLGAKPPFPQHVHAETFSVSADVADLRYCGLELSDFELTLYHAKGGW